MVEGIVVVVVVVANGVRPTAAGDWKRETEEDWSQRTMDDAVVVVAAAWPTCVAADSCGVDFGWARRRVNS